MHPKSIETGLQLEREGSSFVRSCHSSIKQEYQRSQTSSVDPHLQATVQQPRGPPLSGQSLLPSGFVKFDHRKRTKSHSVDVPQYLRGLHLLALDVTTSTAGR